MVAKTPYNKMLPFALAGESPLSKDKLYMQVHISNLKNHKHRQGTFLYEAKSG
jgi:hypothetical protein